jgi:ATP-binding cassette subfamily B protein
VGIFKHVKGLGWPVLAIIFFLMIQAYCDLALPQYMSDIVDIGITQRGIEDATPLFIAEQEAAGVDFSKIQMDYLWNKGSIMLVFSVVAMTAATLVSFFSARTGASMGKQLRDKVFRKIISFSSAEVDSFSTATLITRSTTDIQQVQMASIMILRMILLAPILGIGGIIKVAGTRSGMGWIIGVAVLVILIIVIILMIVAMPRFKKMPLLLDRMNLVSREILTGTNVIRAFSREKYEEKRFDVASTELKNNQLFVSRVMALMMPLMMLIMNIITLAIVWFGARGVDLGNLMVGDMMAFITYTMLIVMSFLMLSMISIMLPRAIVSAKRIDEILVTEATIHDHEKPLDEKLSLLKGVINFEDVSFRYPGADEDALINLSFTANPGETTAIIGSTGCGKSTLLNLIPRFYDVTGGRIMIDDIDIRDITQKKLRNLIGYVPQKGVLFSGDITSNIKFAGDWISDGQMQDAAEVAQASDFIAEKEDQYESEISQGGTNVYGGQRQRLSIARAIAKQARIFLFDDSFSALDYKTDIALRKALNKKISDATVIIVAQRINTIIHADKIIVLDDGKIVGVGRHEELLGSCEAYQEIASSQLSEQELKGGAVS